jgi:hypothetical protein
MDFRVISIFCFSFHSLNSIMNLMSLNSKRYLVVRVRGCRSSGSCVFKRQCKSIFKKGKMDLVYGNFVRNICKKALRFRGVSLYQYDSFVISVINLVLIIVYKLIIFLLKALDMVELRKLRNTILPEKIKWIK